MDKKSMKDLMESQELTNLVSKVFKNSEDDYLRFFSKILELNNLLQQIAFLDLSEKEYRQLTSTLHSLTSTLHLKYDSKIRRELKKNDNY